MRYSLAFAALVASAYATPYINVEVSEPGELLRDDNRHHNQGRLGNHRDHRDDRNRNDRNRDDRDREEDDDEEQGWFSAFWNRGNSNNRNRHNSNNNDRRGRRDRDQGRQGRHRNNGRGDRRRDDDAFSASNLVDDLFGSDYECILQAEGSHAEKRGAERCCEEIGGELYAQQGHCIFRDVYANPREDWRDCAMDQRDVFQADCYYREQREVEDSLRSRRQNDRDNRRDDRDDRRDDRDDRDNHRRNGRNDRDREDEDDEDRQVTRNRDSRRDRDDRRNRDDRRDRDDRRGRDDRRDRDDRSRSHSHQRVISFNDRNNRDRRERIECRVQLDDNNEQGQRELTRNCCRRQEVDGRLVQNDQGCQVDQERRADEFEQCARQSGIQQDQVECYFIRNREEF